MISLNRAHLQEIISHAKEAHPKEACGILAGEGSASPLEGSALPLRVEKVYRVKNIDDSETTYLMDSREQFRILKEMEREGLRMVGIYHSHPASPPYPSPRDIALAFYPDTAYIIIGPGEEPEVNAFRIEEGAVKRIELRIL